MKLYKFVRKYLDGYGNVVLGSLRHKCGYISLDEMPKLPLATYVPGQDTVPETGYLMCYKGIRKDDVLADGWELWEVDADVVDVQVPRLLAPTDKLQAHLKVFWEDPDQYLNLFRSHHNTIRTPAQTIFCSRVRLVEQVA